MEIITIDQKQLLAQQVEAVLSREREQRKTAEDELQKLRQEIALLKAKPKPQLFSICRQPKLKAKDGNLIIIE